MANSLKAGMFLIESRMADAAMGDVDALYELGVAYSTGTSGVEIDFIEADGNYAKLHAGRKTHLLREKMNDLEGRLDPAKFVRIHRSIIVNLERIKEMHPHFNGDYVVVLEDGRQLRLSRTRREQLEARLRVNRG